MGIVPRTIVKAVVLPATSDLAEHKPQRGAGTPHPLFPARRFALTGVKAKVRKDEFARIVLQTTNPQKMPKLTKFEGGDQ